MVYAKKNKWILLALGMMALSVLLFFLLVRSLSASRWMNLLFLLVAQGTFGVGFFIHNLVIRGKALNSREVLIGIYLVVATLLSIILIERHASLAITLLFHLPVLILFWILNYRITRSRYREEVVEESLQPTYDKSLINRLQTLVDKEQDPLAAQEIRRIIQVLYLQTDSRADELEELISGLEVAMQGDVYSAEDRDKKIDEIQHVLYKRDRAIHRESTS